MPIDVASAFFVLRQYVWTTLPYRTWVKGTDDESSEDPFFKVHSMADFLRLTLYRDMAGEAHRSRVINMVSIVLHFPHQNTKINVVQPKSGR